MSCNHFIHEGNAEVLVFYSVNVVYCVVQTFTLQKEEGIITNAVTMN